MTVIGPGGTGTGGSGSGSGSSSGSGPSTVGAVGSDGSATSTFSYSGRSLDDLRGLAGSVDTARIADTQTDFARVAQQMDDVVTQLVAMQSRIPSWWHGASADEAVAKFAQVVNHAQTAYTMADGASRALSTCGNVVAEQQTAMANVPEVAAPQSGFSTAELFAGPSLIQQVAAAQQGHQYEAARTRAVEVVNGIAAQFVETTAQLRNLHPANVDVSFRPYTSTENNGYSPRQNPFSQNTEIGTSSRMAPGERSVSQKDVSIVHDTNFADRSSSPGQVIHYFAEPYGDNQWFADSHARQYLNTVQSKFASTATQPRKPDLADTDLTGSKNSTIGEPHIKHDTDSRLRFSDNTEADESKYDPKRNGNPLGTSVRYHLESLADARELPSINTVNRELADITTHFPGSRLDRASHFASDLIPDTIGNLTTLHGTGAAQHYGTRGRRPPYLKEPKNSWLSDTPTAPSDGILTPDWDEN